MRRTHYLWLAVLLFACGGNSTTVREELYAHRWRQATQIDFFQHAPWYMLDMGGKPVAFWVQESKAAAQWDFCPMHQEFSKKEEFRGADWHRRYGAMKAH